MDIEHELYLKLLQKNRRKRLVYMIIVIFLIITSATMVDYSYKLARYFVISILVLAILGFNIFNKKTVFKKLAKHEYIALALGPIYKYKHIAPLKFYAVIIFTIALPFFFFSQNSVFALLPGLIVPLLIFAVLLDVFYFAYFPQLIFLDIGLGEIYDERANLLGNLFKCKIDKIVGTSIKAGLSEDWKFNPEEQDSWNETEVKIYCIVTENNKKLTLVLPDTFELKQKVAE